MNIEEFGFDDEQAVELKYANLVKALSDDYLNVYLVEPEANKASVIKLDGYITKGILTAPKLFEYSAMLKAYATNRAYYSDRAMFMERLSCQSLLALEDDPIGKIEFTYRVVEDEKIHYYSARYIRISSGTEPIKFIAGFRNVDDIVLEQLKQYEEGIYKAYKALSSIYLAMYRVDVIHDRFHEIKGTALVTNSLIQGNYSYRENVIKATRATTNPAYVEKLIDFVNIDTLPERMKDKHCISMEFLSRIYGYCKASYIKEDDDANGNLFHVLYAVEVIDQDKRREEILRNLADHDSLTNLHNRRSGESRISALLNEKKKGVFCLFDCDSFKEINDTYGHDVGDGVLVKIAESLLSSSNPDDIVMRLGGDEFALFSTAMNTKDEVLDFYEKLKEKLSSIIISPSSDEKVYLSGGVSLVASEKETFFRDIYREADKAMYRAKANRNHSIEFAK